MFNITGQTVLETGLFAEKITLDVQNIPPGLYVFEISDIVSKDRTTKKIVINK
jgi:hypothetical protein